MLSILRSTTTQRLLPKGSFSTVSSVVTTSFGKTNVPEEASPVADELSRYYATGRRKTSVARVWIQPGSGQFVVNEQPFVKYFQSSQRAECMQPFLTAQVAGLFDIWCTVEGGGISGQAGAVTLGISRALEQYNKNLRSPLSKAGLLTRDPRMVERKKPGQKKARKKYQWVKR